MYEHGVRINIGGREFTLVFTLAAFLEIKRKYGGITQMAEAMEGPIVNEWDSDDVKAEKEAKREAAVQKYEQAKQLRIKSGVSSSWLLVSVYTLYCRSEPPSCD